MSNRMIKEHFKLFYCSARAGSKASHLHHARFYLPRNDYTKRIPKNAIGKITSRELSSANPVR